MTFDHRHEEQKLTDFMNSPEGVAWMEEYAKKLKFEYHLKDRNIERLKKMFTDQKSFNLLVSKIIDKHDDAWVKKCYDKNVQPHPMILLYILFDLVEKEGTPIKPFDGLTENFPSQVLSYKSWQFAITHGQGSVCSVYYRKKLKYRD